MEYILKIKQNQKNIKESEKVMKYRQIEKEAIEKFLEAREKNQNVILSFEICPNGFVLRVFDKNRDFKKNEIEHLYAQDNIEETFKELEEKIKKIGG